MIRRILVITMGLALALGPLGARADHGDATGVTEGTITLGLHVPFSGAGGIDAQATSRGADLYWRYLHEQLGVLIHGRRVHVVVENDSYTPSTAVQKCDQMTQSTFLLLGFVGTDQITACANYADPRGIPYLSPGVQESGLSDRTTFFALSATWEHQSPIIAQFVANVLVPNPGCCRTSGDVGGQDPPACRPLLTVPVLDVDIADPFCLETTGAATVGLVRPNTPNYDAPDDELRAALDAFGIGYRVYTVVKEGNSTEAQQVANRMQQDGVDVVVVLTPPVFSTTLAINTGGNGYFPRYLMYGMTSGYDRVLAQTCDQGQMHGASVFSPWPAWSAVAQGEFDPHLSAAIDAYASDIDEGSRDLLVALWGLMKNVHLLLEALGSHPARADLVALLDEGYSHSTGVYPDFAVDEANHFGVNAVHRLEASCEGEPQFHQADAFVTGYPPPEDA
ncbi:MAG TPA: ABC transporter substrate-binding protein [Actinomycetota bacterium]